jgi:hypothetical protein
MLSSTRPLLRLCALDPPKVILWVGYCACHAERSIGHPLAALN